VRIVGTNGGPFILAAILVPILGSLICAALDSRRSSAALVLLAALQFGATLVAGAAVMSSGEVTLEWPWMQSLGAYLSFRADYLSVAFAVLVSGLSLAVAVYARSYMDGPDGKASFFAWQSLFSGSMMGVLFAGDMILFYLFWELMLIPSTALIVYWGQGKHPVRVGVKYYMVTHIGALLMLSGILWTIVLTGTSHMGVSARLLAEANPVAVGRIAVLLAAGFMVKMAVVPGHIWLPDAHSEAQLPTSIMLSAVMMNMGIYGALRFLGGMMPASTLAAMSVPLMVMGIINQWYGGFQALRQQELKRMAAYSTVSQMGYVLFGIGAAGVLGLKGAVMQALAHGVGKALLFMTIGVIIHNTGAHKMEEVGGLGRRMPLAMLCAVAAALTLAGAPPLAAYQSEWQIFAAGISRVGLPLTMLSIGSSILTALYCLGFVMRVFYGEEKTPSGLIADARGGMLSPMLVLALASLALGVFPAISSGWAEVAVSRLLH